jgi:glucose-6-phosphate isomerase
MNKDLEAIESISLNLKQTGIRKQFSAQPSRATDFSFQAAKIDFDFSKTHLNAKLIDAYISLAENQKLTDLRESMFRGDKINTSEDRAVLHTLLRRSEVNNILPQVSKELLTEKNQSEQSYLDLLNRLKEDVDLLGFEVKDIIHVGIGGSVLGPQLLCEALERTKSRYKIHFVSNVDAHEIVSVTNQCDPAKTLLVGVSKTFTTLETITNLETLIEWLTTSGVKQPLSQVVAVTANPDNAIEFGVAKDNIATFPNWVGGRYSLWSSVSVSPFANLPSEQLRLFLKGAEEMDNYFYRTPFQSNVCFLSAALDHFYGNFFGAQTRATFAYDHRLRSLVPYLQQLETESNGKDRLRNGDPVTCQTSPVVWGGVGTDVQHSVFQLLHQGTVMMPSEFILVAEPAHGLIANHKKLLANAIAQSAALLRGQSLQDLDSEHAVGVSEQVLKAKLFSGDRPSSMLTLPRLDAYTLGALIAFYEHRTFTAGVLYGINSFDQMGVELGKKLATQIEPFLNQQSDNNTNGSDSATDLDASTFDASTQRAINKLKTR